MEFAIHPGVGHVSSSDMRRDVDSLLAAAMPEPDAVLAGMAALCGLACLATRAENRRNSA